MFYVVRKVPMPKEGLQYCLIPVASCKDFPTAMTALETAKTELEKDLYYNQGTKILILSEIHSVSLK